MKPRAAGTPVCGIP